MTNVESNLRRELATRRTQANVSLETLASTMGVAHTTIHNLETGATPRAGWDPVVDAYAKVCGFEPMDVWRAAIDMADEKNSSTSPPKTPEEKERIWEQARQENAALRQKAAQGLRGLHKIANS